ncbi:hypothetical protein EYF80_034485 [Liparis tanakae]|uniref:Uncharacterized protein n=1 Tax=Liparis tanakae TaxID=230148 RepID=A0A4Z2GQB8_9TELE|nr:hypothetical protein EYF80_034485 [Liparis tanakae]
MTVKLCPVSLNINRYAVSQSELPYRPCVATAVIRVRLPRSTSNHWYRLENHLLRNSGCFHVLF